ncbi:MAG: NAD-dependent epimerase/dehydratase family protein [Candidatus Levybacteria bacterium]|nr:NAD-dependent epimerase/dehydratase family protein [Candidatus Levybacteria bacterium]
MKDTILLTGATGFLGFNLLNRLIKENIPHIAISRGGDVKNGIFKLNLNNIASVKKFISFHKFSAVFHFAGFVNLNREYVVAKKCIDNNMLGTLNLLEACKDIPLKKFIYSSTEEVYGNNKIPYSETQIPFPPSPYSISKLTSENLIRYYSNINHFKSIILRLATTYGPYMNKSKFISKAIINALDNRTIQLNSGQKKRNYVFVDDVIDAFLLAYRKSLFVETITINIGQNSSIKLSDFINKIVSISNSSSCIKYGALPERATESSEWLMNLSLAKEMLNWAPKIGLDDGLRKTIKFYKDDRIRSV